MDAIQEISRKLDELELHYRVTQGKKSDVIRMNMSTDSGAKMEYVIFPSGSQSDVSVRIFSLVKSPENKREDILKVCNELNSKFRYAKFVLDSDLDVNVEYDIARNNGALGETAMEIIVRFHKIINEAYPMLMRTIWA